MPHPCLQTLSLLSIYLLCMQSEHGKPAFACTLHMLLPLYSENLGIHSGFQRAKESSLCLQVSDMSSVRALVHIGFLSSMHLFAAAHPKTVHASSMYPECTRESWVVSQRIRDQCSICLVPMLCHEA